MEKRRTPISIGLAALLAAAWLSWPGQASAEGQGRYIQTPFAGQRPFQLDAHAGFAWNGFGFAGGARFAFPVMHNGFIPFLNNAAYVNVGADFYYIRVPGITGYKGAYYPGLGLPVALQWEFYFSDRWSAFAELGVNIFLDPWLFQGQGMRALAGYWIVAGVGGRYHFNDFIAITLRLGNPYAVFGVTFLL